MALLVVISATFSIEIFSISEIFSAIYGIYLDEFCFPLTGTGAKYGASVSKIIFSTPIYSTTLYKLLFLNVTTPPIPILYPIEIYILAVSRLPLKQ